MKPAVWPGSPHRLAIALDAGVSRRGADEWVLLQEATQRREELRWLCRGGEAHGLSLAEGPPSPQGDGGLRGRPLHPGGQFLGGSRDFRGPDVWPAMTATSSLSSGQTELGGGVTEPRGLTRSRWGWAPSRVSVCPGCPQAGWSTGGQGRRPAWAACLAG